MEKSSDTTPEPVNQQTLTAETRIVVDTPDINFKEPAIIAALGATVIANIPRLYGLLTQNSYTALMPDWYKNNIPDELDPIYHVSNASITAALIGHALYAYWNSQAKASKEESFGQFVHAIYRTRRYAFLGAISLNAVAELVGYFGKTTPDIADFV